MIVKYDYIIQASKHLRHSGEGITAEYAGKVIIKFLTIVFCHKCSSIVNGNRFGYNSEMRVCNFCLKLIHDYKPESSTNNVNMSSIDFMEAGDNQLRARSASISFPIANPHLEFSSAPSLKQGSLRENSVFSIFNAHNEPKHPDSPSSAPFRKNIKYSKISETNNSSIEFDDELETAYNDEWQPSPFLESTIPQPFSGLPDPETTKKNFNRRSIYSVSRRVSKASTLNILNPTTWIFNPDSPDVGDTVINAVSIKRVSTGEKLPQKMELNSASVQHLNLMMHQVLEQSGIDEIEEWKKTILRMLLKICNILSPDVRNEAEIDIRHYVKIKRIPGGNISDSHYLTGIVATKSAVHKRMMRTLNFPKILILTFPLQYQRVEGEYTSLEPLIAQEREHIKNLVSRIASLKPDLLLVQKSVCNIALEFFLKMDIPVVPNIKYSLLEKISRLTHADVINSIDKLVLNPRMGVCKSFSYKTYMDAEIQGYRKTYMYLETSDSERSGCSLVLRGASAQTLKIVKQVVDLMVFVVYSLKLESSLLQDEYALTPKVEDGNVLPSIKLIKNITDPIQRALKLFEFTIISGSPLLKFPIPYLLLKLRNQEQGQMLLNHAMPIAPMEVKPGASNKLVDLKTQVENSENLDNNNLTNADSVIIPLVKAPVNIETRFILGNADSLSPFNHQNIMFLYSSICKDNNGPCEVPTPTLIEYYRDSDW